MGLELTHEPVTRDTLAEHAKIPIAFVVDRILEVTPGVDLLAGRDDVAVLWDVRVAPAQRGAGVGSALFRAAESWAGAHGCGKLKIETQNINIVACRFYRKMGCTLGRIDRFAYPELPDEVQLLWWKALGAEPPRNSAATCAG